MTMKIEKSNLKDIIILIFLLLVVMVAYSPAYVNIYGFSDDYSTYFVANLSHSNLIKWDVMSGRPVYAVMRYIAQKSIDTTADFTALRIISVISIYILCCYLYFFLKRTNFPGGVLSWIVTPLLLCLLPPIVLFGAWATCFPYVTSILLAGVSYSLLNHCEKLNPYYRIILSFFSLALSFSIYQPTGMTFSLFMLIDNCLNNNKINLKKVMKNAIMIILGMLTSLILSKALPKLIYGESFQRSALAKSAKEKVIWFLDKPLHDSISNYVIFHDKIYFLVSLLVFLSAILFIYKQKNGGQKVVLSLLIIIGSFSPNLIIEEDWVSYRSLVSIYLCIGSVMAFGLSSLTNKFNIKNLALSACAAFSLISCLNFINTNFVEQYKLEVVVLKTAIKEKISKDYDGYLIFDISNPVWNVFSQTKYDEIGSPSIQIPWAIAGFSDSLRKEMHYNFKINTDKSVVKVSNQNCLQNCTIIPVTEKLRELNN